MFGWKEVYVSFDLEEYLRVKAMLEESDIVVKTKIHSDHARTARSVISGANPLIVNISPKAPPSQYQIFVKSDDFQKANAIR